MDISIIGKNIKKYRKIKGYTSKELAEKTNLAHITIRKYEGGVLKPGSYSMYKLSKALDVSIPDILR